MERAQFDFELPIEIEELINQLEDAIERRLLIIDCIQDEIRSWAHCYTDIYYTEEQCEEIIDYYCRRRWF